MPPPFDTCRSVGLHLYKRCLTLVQVKPCGCTSETLHLYKCKVLIISGCLWRRRDARKFPSLGPGETSGFLHPA